MNGVVKYSNVLHSKQEFNL